MNKYSRDAMNTCSTNKYILTYKVFSTYKTLNKRKCIIDSMIIKGV